MIQDGVIKYTSTHTFRPWNNTHPVAFTALDAARTVLHDRKGIGVYTSEDGETIGYGNLSLRLDKKTLPEAGSMERFLISGSGTGEPRILGLNGYSVVCSFDPEANQVVSFGPVRASSESMTHGAVYRANPALQCVIHIHHRELFDRLLAQGWVHTPETVPYGTPELSRAVAVLVATLPDTGGVFVTAGHVEGIFACGTTVQNTLDSLLRLEIS